MAKKTPEEPKVEAPLIVPAKKLPRGLGHKSDKHDPRDLIARAHLGAAANLPNEAMDLESHLRGIRDQLGTSACVGHGVGTAADTRMRKLGLVSPDPSRIAIYTFGRANGRLSADEPLVDEGCFPRDAMKGIRDQGVPAEADWPIDEAHVNDEVPWDVHQKASALRLSAWYRINTVGPARVADICTALAKGYPIAFGCEVDEKFMEFTGKSPVSIIGTNTVGGHMMCCLGYTTNAQGQRVFRNVNSWGETWGDGGLYWAPEGFMTDLRLTDLYVLEVGG